MVTPDEIKRILMDTRGLEDKIDRVLTEAANRGFWPAKIGIGTVVQVAIDSLVAKYRLVGWDISQFYDPRDGDYLQFEEPR